jgi:hypothetical protein
MRGLIQTGNMRTTHSNEVVLSNLLGFTKKRAFVCVCCVDLHFPFHQTIFFGWSKSIMFLFVPATLFPPFDDGIKLCRRMRCVDVDFIYYSGIWPCCSYIFHIISMLLMSPPLN